MGWLEHKVPPPVVMLIVIVAMLLADWWGAFGLAHGFGLYLGAGLCVLALALAIGGLRTLVGQRTTPSPTQIERAKKLVTSGPYRFTRNPMYLGMTIFLIGVASILGSPWFLLGALAFCLYIQRFQIMPEERVMREKFGAEYDSYSQRVRRWI